MPFFLAILLFRISLEVGYVLEVHPLFEYAGFNLLIDYKQYIIGWAICVLGSLFIPHQLTTASSFFVVLAWLLLGVPMLVLFSLDADRAFLPILLLLTAITIISIFTNLKLGRVKAFRPVRGGTKIAVTVAIIMVAQLTLWYVVSGANFSLDLSSVYDTRLSNAELTESGLFAYTNNWTYKIFSLFLFAVAIANKNYFALLMLAIVQLYFYGISSHKSVLFMPFLIFGCWAFFRKKASFTAIPLACSFIILLAISASELFDFSMLSSMFIRRVFLVPADLVFTYVDFFSNNEFVFWSNSFFSALIPYPYSSSIARTIGNYAGSGANANAGFIATGYAHFGFVGVVVYSLIISVLLKFLSFSSKELEPWLMTSLLILPFRTIIVASDLFTSLLTHGLAVTALVLYLYSTDSVKQASITPQ